jgi:hypothetical protein
MWRSVFICIVFVEGGLLFLAAGGFFEVVMVANPSSTAGLIVIGFLALCCPASLDRP